MCSSTSTFRSWGKWKHVLASLQKGDYVFIQFGHNDQKPHQINKYADPDTTYQENLKAFAKEVKAKGAIAILITPPARLLYDEKTKKLKDSHVQSLWHAPEGTRKTDTTYHDAMRKTAQETNTLLLDLNKTSRAAIMALVNYDEMKTYFRFVKAGHPNYPDGIKDKTHFSIKGAALMAKCVTDELRRINSPLTKYLKDGISIEALEREFNKSNN